MSDFKATIEELLSLDLSTYPHDRIEKLMRQFGRFGVVQMVLHPGKTIIRARPLEPGERFTTRSELSYKPAANNTSYQRASTPYQTMFYGNVIPENVPEVEQNNARIIGALETSHLLRNVGHDGEQRVAYSRWTVTKDIPLVAICYHRDFVDKSSHTKDLFEAYHRFCKTLDLDLQERSLAITEYLAGQYAKPDVVHDYDYMPSAIFSEIVVNKGDAGIYYPSVRADGMGFNVAISPEFVNSSLRLVAAGECTLYKQGEHTIGDNDTISLIEDDTMPFTYTPISPLHHMGRDRVMEAFARYAKGHTHTKGGGV